MEGHKFQKWLTKKKKIIFWISSSVTLMQNCYRKTHQLRRDAERIVSEKFIERRGGKS